MYRNALAALELQVSRFQFVQSGRHLLRDCRVRYWPQEVEGQADRVRLLVTPGSLIELSKDNLRHFRNFLGGEVMAKKPAPDKLKRDAAEVQAKIVAGYEKLGQIPGKVPARGRAPQEREGREQARDVPASARTVRRCRAGVRRTGTERQGTFRAKQRVAMAPSADASAETVRQLRGRSGRQALRAVARTCGTERAEQPRPRPRRVPRSAPPTSRMTRSGTLGSA